MRRSVCVRSTPGSGHSLLLAGGNFGMAQKAAEGKLESTNRLRRKVLGNSSSISLSWKKMKIRREKKPGQERKNRWCLAKNDPAVLCLPVGLEV